MGTSGEARAPQYESFRRIHPTGFCQRIFCSLPGPVGSPSGFGVRQFLAFWRRACSHRRFPQRQRKPDSSRFYPERGWVVPTSRSTPL